MTETFAGAAFSEFDDNSVGRVGPPLPCGYIKVCHIFIWGNDMENTIVGAVHFSVSFSLLFHADLFLFLVF